MKPKAYAYVRFSTPDQLEGDSLRRQTEAAEAWARDHGLPLDDNLQLQDLGLSAYSGAHRRKGALGGFLALVKAGKISRGSVLLVENFDRLSREQPLDARDVLRDLLKAGIRIITLQDGLEYSENILNSDIGRLLLSDLFMALAHEESKKKSLRLQAVQGKKRDSARNGGERYSSTCPLWLRPIHENIPADWKRRPKVLGYEIIRERSAIIQEIFNMKLAGLGADRIVSKLNSTPNIWKPNKMDTRRKGNGWMSSYVHKILRNRQVLGEQQFYKFQTIDGVRRRVPESDVIPNYYPKVIPERTFFQVQALFKQNRGGGGANGQAHNIFQGRVQCGYCGSSAHYLGKGDRSKGNNWLVCDHSRRHMEAACGCTAGFPYGEFQALVLNYCKGLSAEQIEEILGGVDHKKRTELLVVQSDLSAKREKLCDVRMRIDSIIDQIELVGGNLENRIMLDRRLDQRRAEIDELEAEISALESRHAQLSNKPESFIESIESIKRLERLLEKASENKAVDIRLKLRQVLKGLIEKIVIYPEGMPRYTPEAAERALQDLSTIFPDGTEENQWLKDYLKRQIDNPKGYRLFSIHFTTGTRRVIRPCFPGRELSAEFDHERGEWRAWKAKAPNAELQERMDRFESVMRNWELAHATGGTEALDKMWAEASI